MNAVKRVVVAYSKRIFWVYHIENAQPGLISAYEYKWPANFVVVGKAFPVGMPCSYSVINVFVWQLAVQRWLEVENAQGADIEIQFLQSRSCRRVLA